jgi:hypothetical protein
MFVSCQTDEMEILAQPLCVTQKGYRSEFQNLPIKSFTSKKKEIVFFTFLLHTYFNDYLTTYYDTSAKGKGHLKTRLISFFHTRFAMNPFCHMHYNILYLLWLYVI